MPKRLMEIECSFCKRRLTMEASPSLMLTCSGCGGGSWRVVRFFDETGEALCLTGRRT